MVEREGRCGAGCISVIAVISPVETENKKKNKTQPGENKLQFVVANSSISLVTHSRRTKKKDLQLTGHAHRIERAIWAELAKRFNSKQKKSIFW